MTYSSNLDRGRAAVVAFLVTAIGAAFAYVVLDPSIGIDDANITQVFARNIAAGHGYVYNVGGERVEGSTSLLWTLVNVAFFSVSETPEMLLAGFCALMTFATIFCAMRLSRDLMKDRGPTPALLVGVAFLAFPAYFGWMVWSLMDITIWVFLITLTVRTLHNIQDSEPTSLQIVWLILLATLLPLTRPEGLALTIGLAGFIFLRWFLIGGPGRKVGFAIAISGTTSFAVATLWRLSHFGFPFPNTFYAKTSTDFLYQFEQGIRYLVSYLQEPQNALLLVTFCLSGALLVARKSVSSRSTLWLALYLIVGGALIYTLLGGDHFGSHRQFLYFLPIALPIIATGLAGRLQSGERSSQRAFFMLLPFILIGLASGVRFLQTKGGMSIEFAIADTGRELGTKLNSLPDEPSIGVFAAGALRMSYEHEVLDLLGLNWTVMAHAPDDGYRASVPNQHGFNSDVFWQTPPDVFPIFPSNGQCPDEWAPLSGYLDAASDQISQTERFRQDYGLYCDDGDAFYASNDYVERSWTTETKEYYRLSRNF